MHVTKLYCIFIQKIEISGRENRKDQCFLKEKTNHREKLLLIKQSISAKHSIRFCYMAHNNNLEFCELEEECQPYQKMLSPGCLGIHWSCSFCSDEAKVEINEDVTLTGITKAGHPVLDRLQLAQGSGKGGDCRFVEEGGFAKALLKNFVFARKVALPKPYYKKLRDCSQKHKVDVLLQRFFLWTHIHGDLFRFLLIFSIQLLFFK